MATAEFNQDYLYTLRMRSLFRGLARTLIIVCALGIVLLGSADYFANLPRERFARKFSYWQRVQYGFSQSLRAVWLRPLRLRV